MRKQNTSKEHIQRTNPVVNYILNHLREDLNLDKLAAIANYSPFHFQKIFKRVTGESPKQFIIRLRLEISTHLLIAHHHKSITEIALDSGFASPSTFARAFKTYFGVPADELRNLFLNDKIKFHQLLSSKKNSSVKYFSKEHSTKYSNKNLEIKIDKISSLQVVFVNASLGDADKIQDGFKKIIQLAEAYDLLTSDSKFIGIINPHAGLYQAAVTIQPNQSRSKKLNIAEIEGGKFAICKVKGDILQTFKMLHAFRELWLSKSAYIIKEFYIFEILSKNPSESPYDDIPREIYIPIEAA